MIEQGPAETKLSTPAGVTVHTPVVAELYVIERPELDVAVSAGGVDVNGVSAGCGNVIVFTPAPMAMFCVTRVAGLMFASPA